MHKLNFKQPNNHMKKALEKILNVHTSYHVQNCNFSDEWNPGAARDTEKITHLHIFPSSLRQSDGCGSLLRNDFGWVR